MLYIAYYFCRTGIGNMTPCLLPAHTVYRPTHEHLYRPGKVLILYISCDWRRLYHHSSSHRHLARQFSTSMPAAFKILLQLAGWSIITFVTRYLVQQKHRGFCYQRTPCRLKRQVGQDDRACMYLTACADGSVLNLLQYCPEIRQQDSHVWCMGHRVWPGSIFEPFKLLLADVLQSTSEEERELRTAADRAIIQPPLLATQRSGYLRAVPCPNLKMLIIERQLCLHIGFCVARTLTFLTNQPYTSDMLHHT